MPFPLAHPAAVLPLRRYCPRVLSFPALLIGSLSPDLGYCLSPLHAHEFAHEWLGIFGFCLPAGLLALWLFYRFRSPVVASLPERCRRVLLPLCRRPPAPVRVLVLSVLIGAATHVLWDSFTHREGWFVQRVGVLQDPIAAFGGRQVRVFHLLWYACSFGGVAWLCLAYERWKQADNDGAELRAGRPSVGKAVVFATLVVLIGAVHHLIRHWLGYCLVGILTAGLLAGILWSIGGATAGAGRREA